MNEDLLIIVLLYVNSSKQKYFYINDGTNITFGSDFVNNKQLFNMYKYNYIH